MKYSNKEILDRLIKFREVYGKNPTKPLWKDLNQRPYSSTISKRFGTWNKALIQAGLPVNRVVRGSKEYRCTLCDNKFSRHVSQVKTENVFCSKSCSTVYNNSCKPFEELGLGESFLSEHARIDSAGIVTPKFCLGCGNPLTTIESAKYCSHECQQTYQWLLKRSQIITHPLKSESSKLLKRILVEDRGERCEICYRNKWNGKSIPLELDHIDGNSENNYLQNLRQLCPNCHAQTDTYKAKNIGMGRHSRRKRYKAGKSY